MNTTETALYPIDLIPGWSFIFIILGTVALGIACVCLVITIQSVFDFIKPKVVNVVNKNILKKEPHLTQELLETGSLNHD